MDEDQATQMSKDENSNSSRDLKNRTNSTPEKQNIVAHGSRADFSHDVPVTNGYEKDAVSKQAAPSHESLQKESSPQVEGDMDLVIIEADCSADESAVKSACRSGVGTPWPDDDAKLKMLHQRQQLLQGFKVCTILPQRTIVIWLWLTYFNMKYTLN